MDEEHQSHPVRIAVALRYEPGRDGVPVIVAKGRGELAERIVERAKENGVEVKEDRDLSTALAKLEVDQKIPAELFKAVAAIIGFVMRKKAGLSAR